MKQRPHFKPEGSIELVAEANYAAIEFVFEESRIEKIKRMFLDAVLVGAFFAAEWLIVWGVARAL